MTSPAGRRAPRGARRSSSSLGSAALAVPGGAAQGALIGSQFALVDTIAQAYQLRGSGFGSWLGFALLEGVIAVGVGVIAGAFVGLVVSGALAAAWVARFGGIATSVIGAVTAALASTCLLLLWFGASAPLFWFAAYASVCGAGGVVVLVRVATPRRLGDDGVRRGVERP
ncbi:MAG: hypothetical protein EPO52_14955 [Herbiconiux sp.]|uniref:hypothetical protein n=1 Tax=Herbiconiux sp. TaxID=1871186 RepID=UPI0012113B82|nr:hypothetical protein [Herbiconiux sp.]TAJ46833.1 MAG: hypothetical protein EPO52_14955 [Herbiconiux sp.]